VSKQIAGCSELLSLEGARALRHHLQEYWASRGRVIDVVIVRSGRVDFGAGRPTHVYGLRSSLRGGWPAPGDAFVHPTDIVVA
jgi:hypothetical protein